MHVTIELDDEQVDDVLEEGLKSAYQTHLMFVEDSEEYTFEELDNAFKLILKYFMLDKDYRKFMHDVAKVQKKYNSKRMVEAEGGL